MLRAHSLCQHDLRTPSLVAHPPLSPQLWCWMRKSPRRKYGHSTPSSFSSPWQRTRALISENLRGLLLIGATLVRFRPSVRRGRLRPLLKYKERESGRKVFKGAGFLLLEGLMIETPAFTQARFRRTIIKHPASRQTSACPRTSGLGIKRALTAATMSHLGVYQMIGRARLRAMQAHGRIVM